MEKCCSEKNPQKVRKKKLVSLVNRRDYCVVTLSLSRRNSQGKFKYSQHFVPLACRLCSGQSVLASVALKCLPGGRRLKQGGGSFTMLWTPENFFFVVAQPMILSAVRVKMLSMERRYVRCLFRSVLGENAVTAVPPERRLLC